MKIETASNGSRKRITTHTGDGVDLIKEHVEDVSFLFLYETPMSQLPDWFLDMKNLESIYAPNSTFFECSELASLPSLSVAYLPPTISAQSRDAFLTAGFLEVGGNDYAYYKKGTAIYNSIVGMLSPSEYVRKSMRSQSVIEPSAREKTGGKIINY